VEEVTRGDRVPFVINGPGEYEVSGIFVRGFATTGPAAKINTAYTLVLDDIKVVHLGALAGGELPAEAAEALGGPDLLFVPIGGGERLEAKQAAKLATALAAKLVVPVDYEDDEALKTFLKEMGAEQVKPLESLTLRRKDLADKEGEVTVIKSW
jgi:L-ascorbate metabolism protein UlaG (beta-lactamase superfamily)